jgi:hypothetical protein
MLLDTAFGGLCASMWNDTVSPSFSPVRGVVAVTVTGRLAVSALTFGSVRHSTTATAMSNSAITIKALAVFSVRRAAILSDLP